MSVFFPLDTFFENSGKQVNEFNEKIRDEVATFACELWQQFPDWMTQNSLPATSFARGFYNSMCAPIQAPINPPEGSFVGGQCEGVEYDVTCRTVAYQFSTCQLLVDSEETFRVLGPVEGTQYNVTNSQVSTSSCFNLNDDPVDIGNWVLVSGSGQTNIFSNIWVDTERKSNPPLSISTVTNVVRVDGLPDDCGDGPGRYPSPPPTSEDLRKLVNIQINDGLDFQLEIVYNQHNNVYNFPTTFKVNGVNVSIDLGGITIYGNPQNTGPSGSDPVDPPGFDGGDDGMGGSNDKVYPGEFPTIPDWVSPEVITDLIEYLICIDGVLETVEEVIKQIPSISGPFAIILKVLLNILQDVCEMPESLEATVGLPEYYGLKPGTERPAIVYLWKEYVDETWGKSTYSSTVHHPTQQAIADIDTIISFTKNMGTNVKSLKLTDGSVIKATGQTLIDAESSFNFLLGQVEPQFIPVDQSSRTVDSIQLGLEEKTVRLRQIEYYPFGKDANRSPTIRRVLKAPQGA